MKSASILSVGALFASASASATHPNVHVVADLMARAIDPATMDSTKLSVLSVLKTAMPTPTGTETAIALPTGDVTPQWYKDLPADVMVLLAQMYPATSTSTSTSAAASTASASASQSTLTKSLDHVPTVTGISNGTLSSNNITSAVGTLSTSKPTPSQSAISTGVKNTVGTGSLSVAMGLSVAALFCLLA